MSWLLHSRCRPEREIQDELVSGILVIMIAAIKGLYYVRRRTSNLASRKRIELLSSGSKQTSYPLDEQLKIGTRSETRTHKP